MPRSSCFLCSWWTLIPWGLWNVSGTRNPHLRIPSAYGWQPLQGIRQRSLRPHNPSMCLVYFRTEVSAWGIVMIWAKPISPFFPIDNTWPPLEALMSAFCKSTHISAQKLMVHWVRSSACDSSWCQMFQRKAESPHDGINHKKLKHREKSFLTQGGDQSQVLRQHDHYCWQNFILASVAAHTIFPYKLSWVHYEQLVTINSYYTFRQSLTIFSNSYPVNRCVNHCIKQGI